MPVDTLPGTFPAIGSPAGNRLDATVAAIMCVAGGLVMLAVTGLVPHHGLMAGAGGASVLVGIWAWCTPASAPVWARQAYTVVAVAVTVVATAAAELSTELRLGPAVLLCPILVIACLRRARHALPQLAWGTVAYSGYLFTTVPPAAAVTGVLAVGLSLTMVSTMAILLRGSLDRVVQGWQHQAERDPLTGLLNRRGLRRELADGPSAPTGAATLLDLDHFKLVNDVHGHHEGDDTLIWFAELLTRFLQHGDRCARLGGEEFIVVRPGATADATVTWAEQVRAAVAAESGRRRAPITVSAGVSYGPLDDLTQLLDRADRALYRAKSAGRNRVERATPGDAAQPTPTVCRPGSITTTTRSSPRE